MAERMEFSTARHADAACFAASPAAFDAKAEKVLLTERAKNTVPYFSIEALKKAANIEDQRYLFF